jgi:hypothetical protein
MTDGTEQNDFITPLIAGALQMHELFVAMITAGFNEGQALYLIGQSLHGDAMGRSAKQ